MSHTCVCSTLVCSVERVSAHLCALLVVIVCISSMCVLRPVAWPHGARSSRLRLWMRVEQNRAADHWSAYFQSKRADVVYWSLLRLCEERSEDAKWMCCSHCLCQHLGHEPTPHCVRPTYFSCCPTKNFTLAPLLVRKRQSHGVITLGRTYKGPCLGKWSWN